MRALVLLLCGAFPVLSGAAAPAQQSDGIYADSVRNDQANFHYAANADTRGDGAQFMRYIICNGHGSMPLQFKWREPGMASGQTCPLAAEQCGMLKRRAPFGVRPLETTLDYWQMRYGTVTPTVSLPLPDPAPPDGFGARGGWLASEFWAVFGRDGDCPPEHFEAEVASNATEGGDVRLFIHYSPRRIIIAIGLADGQVESANVEQIGAAMRELGGSAEVAALDTLIEADLAAEIAGEGETLQALVLSLGEEAQLPLFLDLKAESAALVNAPVILAEDGRMMARFDAWVWLPQQ
ncbi:hypothetical protein [Cribrihabitans neustonicus]|uniref:hypothetical protein n=1 Tax=Cribrihabitans neustonicus TaxID=1429085 RepID=UPI003B5C19D0